MALHNESAILASAPDIGRLSVLQDGELADADFIVLETDESDTQEDQKKAVEDLKSSKLWAGLPAVKQDRVLVSSTEIWRGNGYISNSVALDQVIGFFNQ